MNSQQIDALVEQLRCARCNDYLSWPPIVLLPDGTSACGHCTPPLPRENPDGSVIRQVALEQVLLKLSFPCKYKPEGCQDRQLFGYRNHPEEDCVYHPVPCPTETCPWSGSMLDMLKHFAEAHSAMVKNKLEFKLKLDQDAEDIVLAVIEEVPFLIKYVYTADKAELVFAMNCLSLNKSSYKLWMFNDDIVDCGFSIKQEKCFPYNCQRFKCFTLILDKYLPALENPDSILVRMQIIFEISVKSGAAAPKHSAGVPVIANMAGLRLACFPLVPILSVRRTQ